MQSQFTLTRRDGGSTVTIDLIIVLLILILVSLGCVGALWFLRRKRRTREALLPTYGEATEKLGTSSQMGHRRLSGISVSSSKTPFSGIRRASAKFVDEEKQQFMATTTPPPTSDKLPQICVTFPEDTDHAGKRQSGRSVLLHIDDKGSVGMEPIHHDENLPPYEAERFESLDLDRVGGLKEKVYSHGKPVAAA